MNTQRLYRSRKDRMIGGVCGGLANFFNIDPTIVRLIFVLLFLTGSAGFWIYLILLVVIPEEPQISSGDVIDVITSEEKKEG